MKTSSVLSNLRNRAPFTAIAFLATFLLPLLTSPTAMALSQKNGDPFSNGTFFPNEGTFQTTIRGVNLSGVATFSTGGEDTGFSTSSGTFAVAYKGVTYSGGMDASIDPAGGTIAATMEASVAASGTGTVTSSSTETLSSSFEQTGTQTDTIDNPDSFVIDPITGAVTTIAGGQSVVSSGIFGWVDTIENSSTTSDYLDSSYVSGAFTAKLKNSFPNQIFKGKGTMTFQEIDFSLLPPSLVSTVVNISVKGARTSNTAQSYADPATVEKPYVITTGSNSTVVTNRGTN